MIKIDMISDLHGEYPRLDGGDLLIVAGDLIARDTIDEYLQFNKWLSDQDYKRKIVIAGNHDNLCENGVPIDSGYGQIPGAVPILADKAVYLCDSATEFEGLKIWGSPWSLWFPEINPHCSAFTCMSNEINEKWKLIPDDIDILITHSPPWGQLDWIESDEGIEGMKSLGCMNLMRHVYNIQPMLHVFGHIHNCGGKMSEMGGKLIVKKRESIFFVNASIMNEDYEAVNPVSTLYYNPQTKQLSPFKN